VLLVKKVHLEILRENVSFVLKHAHNVQMQSIVPFLRIILSSSEISLLSVDLDVPPVLEIILKFA
jgi:hypothetical protein